MLWYSIIHGEIIVVIIALKLYLFFIMFCINLDRIDIVYITIVNYNITIV